MATVRDLARQTGVSPATVSRALKSHPDVSELTRIKVLEAAKEVGYSNGLAAETVQSAESVGYVISGDPTLCEYDWMLLDGISEGLRDSHFSLQIVNMQKGKRPDETFKQYFQRQGLQGVILRSFLQNRSTCRQILAEDFPSIVVGDRYDELENSNFVCCDSTGETAKAVHHLVDLGHQRIAIVMHRRADRDHMDRYHGFQQACEERGIELDSDLELRVVADFDGGQTALNRLMSLANPPTAIVFADPQPGIGAICRAHEIGLQIPRDLSIVGFDDGWTRKQIFPVMTAVCQDTRELGVEAAVWLTGKLGGLGKKPCRQVIHAHLEINQTTGVPPAKPVRLQPSGAVIE